MTTFVIDYGTGNLRSVVNALDELGEDFRIVRDPAILQDAERIVLPGVGAMAPAMARLVDSGLIEALDHAVRVRKVPLLGICLGMQMMCETGHENGISKGLGWIGGDVRALSANPPEWRVPHMGWAELLEKQDMPLFEGLRDNAAFYFCHGYFADADPEFVAGRVAFNGHALPAVLWRGSAMGVQFHPERSGNNGLKLIENFLVWDGKECAA